MHCDRVVFLNVPEFYGKFIYRTILIGSAYFNDNV